MPIWLAFQPTCNLVVYIKLKLILAFRFSLLTNVAYQIAGFFRFFMFLNDFWWKRSFSSSKRFLNRWYYFWMWWLILRLFLTFMPLILMIFCENLLLFITNWFKLWLLSRLDDFIFLWFLEINTLDGDWRSSHSRRRFTNWWRWSSKAFSWWRRLEDFFLDFFFTWKNFFVLLFRLSLWLLQSNWFI